MKTQYFFLFGVGFLALTAATAQAKPLKELESLYTYEQLVGSIEPLPQELGSPDQYQQDIGNAHRSLDGINPPLQSLEPIPSSNPFMSQVTGVSELRDVEPNDWAYEALRSLVERYGCLEGYPDGSFRGDRALTRYEFAAGLNACLEQIELIISGGTETVAEEDLATLQRLSQDFATELAAIEGRVDNLEDRLTFLEDNQFSTTATFNGEVVFAIADAFGGDPPGGCSIDPDGSDVNSEPDVKCNNAGNPETNPIFGHLTRLGVQASFTGQDRLRLLLTTGNFQDGGFANAESLNTFMSQLAYQADLDNEFILDILEYRAPILNDRVAISVIPVGFSLSEVLTSNSPYFDIGRGSISRFGQLNPIYRIGGVLDAGAGFDWLISDQVRFQAAYGAEGTSDSESGLFGADTSVLGAQLLVQPSENMLAGLSYVNSYASDGTLGTFTGSVNADTLGLWSNASIPSTGLGTPANINPDAPSGFGCCGLPVGDLAAQINAVGANFQWRLSENLTFATWGGYIFANFLDELPDDPALGASAGKEPFANVATYSLSLGLSEPFGREGDLLAFIFGMPPKLIDAGPETVGVPVNFSERVVRGGEAVQVSDNNPNIFNGPQRVGEEDEATSLHFEFFYRFRVNDNISITPGFFFVTNPGHIADNDTIYVGTIRTTFRF